MAKVSVLISAYNVESYIGGCLKSVIDQDFADIEILIMDDGSTDNTAVIAADYAKIDDRIKIISRENKGLAVSRNDLLEESTGEYILFIDPDDEFAEGAISKVYSKAIETDADMVIFNAYAYDDKTGRGLVSTYIIPEILKGRDELIPKEEPFNAIMSSSVVAWNKLYKRSFIEKNGLRFQEINNFEDVSFGITALAVADKLAYVKENLIKYRRFRSGCQSLFDKNNYMTNICSCEHTINSLKGRGLWDNAEIKRAVVNRIISNARYLILSVDRYETYKLMFTELRNRADDFSLYGWEKEDFICDTYYRFYEALCADEIDDFLINELKTVLRFNMINHKRWIEAEDMLRANKEEIKGLETSISLLEQEKEKSENEIRVIRNSKTFRLIRRVAKIFGKK